MPRFKYVILAHAREGHDDEFGRWYDKQHLADVLKVPGVISGERFPVVFQKAYDVDVPAYSSLTIYEIETDDPEAFLAHIASIGGSAAMPLSDALDKSGMVQAVGLIREEN